MGSSVAGPARSCRSEQDQTYLVIRLHSCAGTSRPSATASAGKNQPTFVTNSVYECSLAYGRRGAPVTTHDHGFCAGAIVPLCSPPFAARWRPQRLRPPSCQAQADPGGESDRARRQTDEAVWKQAPSINEFVQRDPAEGDAAVAAHRRAHRLRRRRALCGRPRLRRASRIESSACSRGAISDRRQTGSGSSSIRIYDRRSAYEFGVNPVGVKTDRYYFNDGNSDDSWDAVWDVQVDARRRGLDAPSSAFRSRSCASATPMAAPVGFAVIREVGRLAETSTWPLLSRNANGFVSQFAEVRGLRMGGRAQEARAAAVYAGQLLDASRPSDNPLVERNDPAGSVGLDLKYARSTRPHADGDGQS